MPEVTLHRRGIVDRARCATGTCAVGYNNIRFDDEFTRHILFRNLHDAYAHEWQNGNSRWDLLDIVRLTRALRPDGITGHCHEDGSPSNRLEHITRGQCPLAHAQAHDALSDVEATIDVARLIRRHQPRLFDYCFSASGQAQRGDDPERAQRRHPCVQVSGMIPARHGHAAIVMPLVRHPVNRNAVIVFDLSDAPEQLIGLDADAIARRVFGPADEAPRLKLRTVQINRCPVLVPLATLRDADAERLDINLATQLDHAHTLQAMEQDGSLAQITEQIATAMTRDWDDEPVDVDASLYGGAFFGTADKQAMERIRGTPPERLAGLQPVFDDPRLDALFFRYRARNHPATLSTDEWRHWQDHCRERLQREGAPWLTFTTFREQLRTVQWRESESMLRAQLEQFADTVQQDLSDTIGDG